MAGIAHLLVYFNMLDTMKYMDNIMLYHCTLHVAAATCAAPDSAAACRTARPQE